MSLTHGLLFLGSAPVNLIVTSVVTADGLLAYRYDHGDISFEELKMFARFPQGMPPNIDVSELRAHYPKD